MRPFIFLILSLILSCQTNQNTNGLQPDYTFYLPGNVIFLPSFAAQKNKETEFLFSTLDKQILASFEEQSFIDGFSPDFLLYQLKKEKKESLLSELKEKILLYDSSENFIDFYRKKLETDPNFLVLIKKISQSCAYSDTLFFPVISQIKEEKINQRGLLIAQRSLELSLVLVEAESGALIWWEQRTVPLSEQKLAAPPDFDYPSYPSWKIFENKLIVGGLWRTFPGWQY